MYIPRSVLKWPPRLIGAESQMIGCPGVTETEYSLIVAKKVVSAEKRKANKREIKSTVEKNS